MADIKTMVYNLLYAIAKFFWDMVEGGLAE